ncbi:hypothetical protein FG386_000243 [Cryptosporidium ryanae]|uniref:uncharacterized protein n=1 Tax=Cryptosporidium ryanae TaxID=515981 RepID=UPI00351A3A12|nr:hypothetical protein FG386_000243 [Cryptosporidium ryanae]
MNNSIHNNPSVDLLNEIKIAGNYQLTTYNENQFNDISKINYNHIENLHYLKPFISNESSESQYDVAALVHLLSLQRNKMRVLSFLWNYGKVLSFIVKSRMSDKETEFFNEYCGLIDEYNKTIIKKLNIPDLDICKQSINNNNETLALCQIQNSKLLTKNFISYDNGKLEIKNQNIFYNSGSFSFFNDDEITSLEKESTIISIKNK